MRFRLITSIIITCFVLHGCDEPSSLQANEYDKTAGLTGRWRQKASFFSIGDATVHRRAVADSIYQFIQFNADSTIETNISMLSTFKKYGVLDSSTLQFTANNLQPSSNKYSKSGDTLDLYFQCIEVCGGSFVKE